MVIDLETIATDPKKASNQNGMMEKHSLKDVIEADRYNRANDAAASPTATNNPFTRGVFKAISAGIR